jgi:hypothetical protein
VKEAQLSIHERSMRYMCLCQLFLNQSLFAGSLSGSWCGSSSSSNSIPSRSNKSSKSNKITVAANMHNRTRGRRTCLVNCVMSWDKKKPCELWYWEYTTWNGNIPGNATIVKKEPV